MRSLAVECEPSASVPLSNRLQLAGVNRQSKYGLLKNIGKYGTPITRATWFHKNRCAEVTTSLLRNYLTPGNRGETPRFPVLLRVAFMGAAHIRTTRRIRGVTVTGRECAPSPLCVSETYIVPIPPAEDVIRWVASVVNRKDNEMVNMTEISDAAERNGDLLSSTSPVRMRNAFRHRHVFREEAEQPANEGSVPGSPRARDDSSLLSAFRNQSATFGLLPAATAYYPSTHGKKLHEEAPVSRSINWGGARQTCAAYSPTTVIGSLTLEDEELLQTVGCSGKPGGKTLPSNRVLNFRLGPGGRMVPGCGTRYQKRGIEPCNADSKGGWPSD